MRTKKKILLTVDEEIIKMAEEVMLKDFIDTPSQLFTRLVLAEHRAMNVKRGRPLKENNQDQPKEESQEEEADVWWEGDDMNEGRFMTKTEYEARKMSQGN